MSTEKPQIANPIPSLVFTFTLIVIMIWATSSGVVKQEGILLLGLFQLACMPVYLAGSKMLMAAGDSLSGNIFLIFTTSFGGISGLANIAVGVTGYLGLPIDMKLYFFPLLWSGIVLIAVSIAFRKADLPTWIAFVGGAWTLTTGALMGLGIIPPVLNSVNNIISIIVAACGLYTVFADLCSMGGINVPKGPSLFK